MADTGGVSFEHLDILNLTAEEKRAYKQLFTQADNDSSGIITGEVAVKFLERTLVPGAILGEIWQIADQENRGFLTPAGFAVCLRLIGHYQAGKDPDSKLAFQPGPLPKFDGISVAAGAPPPSGPPPGIQPQLSGSAGGPIRVPPLTPEKAADYAGLFERSGAHNGIMSGDAAKQIFEKARLPNDVLGRIWNLSDTEQRGALSVTEFIIAMHLLASFKSRAMAGVPATLPAGLYEAAARRGPVARGPGGPPPGGPGPGPIPRQFSGAQPGRTSSPLARTPYGVSSPTTAAPRQDWDWDVTPQEKQQYDGLFDKVDIARNGFITGEQAVVFFSESGLSEDYLATIWDLSDILSEGKLNRDEFAVAMYLIRLQRGKPTSVLPTSLPERLIPPSMRNQRPVSQTTAPAFDNAAHATGISKSASEDLFGLDALTSSPTSAQIPQIPQIPQSTGGSAAPVRASADPFGSQPSSPKSPTSSQFFAGPSAGGFKPFKPTSAFGQGLQTQNTGASAGSAGSAPRQPQTPNFDDLLGDNDPEISKKLTKETTELANMSNQIGTLRTQMEEVQSKKVTTENDLNRTSTQKRDLELRLSQFRSQYENEIRNVKALEERLNASRADTEKLRRDYAMVEGSFQDLQNQHRQVADALSTDQRENASLKQKISEMNTEINQLKPQLEKMRSDARQQKGLVAINKKQLSTSEGERDKIKNEMSDLSKAAEERARASPAPDTSSVISPAISTASQSTNPFFRRTPQQSFSDSRSPGPPSRAGTGTQENYDNFFGPSSFTSQGAAPPQTTFRSESNVPAFSTQAGSSVISSEPGVPTPSTSPPLSSYHESPQPPAPPESTQMTSKQLPLREPVALTESLGSSVRVGTPGSRQGGPGTDTPTNLAASPAPASISSRGLERNDSNRTETFNAFDRASNASPASGSAAIPGAFPDPSPAQRSTTVDSKSDFDAAFANYPSTKQPQERQHTGSSLNGSVASGPPLRFHQEFPPIEDVGQDDDSDTSEDQGFADNFGSPGRKKEADAPPAEPTEPSESKSNDDTDDLYTPRPTMQHLGSSALSDLPGPNAQKSPPSYGETLALEHSHGSGSNSFPPEFGGLLPSREDPTVNTSPPPPQEARAQSPEDRFGGPVGGGGGQGHALFGGGPSSSAKASSPPPAQESSGSTASDAYQSAVSYPSTQNKSPSGSQPPQISKTAFGDDFDTGFDDLAEAKEDEQDDGDEFMPASQHHDAFDEFNPVFDSPAASKTNTMASLATPTGKATTSQPMDNSFGDFEQDIENAFGSSSTSAAKSGGQDTGAGSTNWDDIFGSVDKHPAESKPDVSAANTGFSFPEPPSKSKSNSQDDAATLTPLAAASEADKGQMPQLGRALSAGTEHDDPILKQLTAKGYPRTEALNTLEKYDYDYNKALDELSQGDVTQLTNMGFSKSDAVKALQAYDYDLNKAANYLTSK
ncbi:hypothetical protein NA57DRAFT_77698 [Rhizodiscina lignyota]|uniref:Uncharacterized protein n=1 Tax=Rhizodiscina lignyota TaxID=1504668 RepID=A0A9P4IDU2_9PEZI|nr:hypothetical protein NA57DRAFT_77698 [Rhizodiscina lignyota]